MHISAEQRVVPLLKVGLAELEFHGGELALQDSDKKVAAPARRLKEAASQCARFRP